VVAFLKQLSLLLQNLNSYKKKDNHLVHLTFNFNKRLVAQCKPKFDFNNIPNISFKYIYKFDHEFTRGSGIYMLNLPTWIQTLHKGGKYS
jgi:hypothetical protein